jgi:Cu2+-exporting ATPase
VPQGLGALSPLERAALLGLSQASAHPLSAAISAQLQADETTPVIADDVREEPGEGVSGRVAGAAARLGKPRGHGSGTAVIFSLAGWPDRIIRFEDSLHTDAADTVAQLRSAGLNVSILSGDDSAAVERLSGALAVDGIAGARPAEKLAVIRDQQARAGRF